MRRRIAPQGSWVDDLFESLPTPLAGLLMVLALPVVTGLCGLGAVFVFNGCGGLLRFLGVSQQWLDDWEIWLAVGSFLAVLFGSLYFFKSRSALKNIRNELSQLAEDKSVQQQEHIMWAIRRCLDGLNSAR